jgi:hypothetical protein
MCLVGDARECMFLVEGQHTIAYILLCHFMCVCASGRQYQEVFNGFHVGLVFTLKTDAFYG